MNFIKFTILIAVTLNLTACGGFYAKKINNPKNINITSLNFGTESQEYIKAYLASNKKSNYNYSTYYKESGLYEFLDFKRINSKPQIVCIGSLYDITNCTSHFKPPYKKMTGVWHINQYFKAEPWGIMDIFVSGLTYAQLIKYHGEDYETAVIEINDLTKLLKSKEKRHKSTKIKHLNLKDFYKDIKINQ